MAYLLVVEDDVAISDLIAMNLSLAGHSCKQIYEGDKVIAELAKKKADLILLDIMLPGIDGFTLMERIRQLQIPVIFIS